LRFKRSGIRELAYGQLIFDAVIAMVIVELTGGVESVFIFVFSLNVLNGAAVLQKVGARVIAAVGAALYSLVLAGEATGFVLPLGVDRAPELSALLAPFLTNTASFALVALLAGFLSEQLSKTSDSLDVARAQLERIEELYRAVLESLPSGVLTVDQGGRIVYVNSSGAEILGRTPEKFVGARLADEAPALAVEDAAGAHARFERPATIDKQERMIGGSVARLTGLEGVAGRVIVFQDLTELRRLQQDKESAERLAELGRFAAGLAHEIRNPLAAMIGCLQLLRSDRALDGDGARMLDIVHREAERLSGLVSEFLTYARPSPPVVEATALRALAVETVSVMRTGIAENIALDVDDGDEVVASCDASQVRQALWNLIGNAAQAIRQNDESKSGRVVVRVSAEGREAVLRVDDDGPGVPDEVLPRIFEPFFTTRPDGTGLGLATVQQTLAQQRGTIEVGKSPLGGARFTVRLARATPA
jgi:two-component system sensor histidine kinase PilS (NtrC family)